MPVEEVSVVSAPFKAKDTIRSMLSTYLKELGVAQDYPYFDLYWEETDDRYPYLFRFGANYCGFAFVRSSRMLEMAEFYVAPDYRRSGIGRKAVTELIGGSDGVWSIRVLPGNDAGLSFWRSVLKEPVVANLNESRIADGFEFKFVSFGGNDS